MRTPIVAGNWKMHRTAAEGRALAVALVEKMGTPRGVEVVLCPPFTALAAVGAAVHRTALRLGAQNMHWEAQGAFTGEISAAMLVDAGCRHVILGHSERRQHFGETDEGVNRKAHAALRAGLVPIVCVGERLEERKAGRTDQVVRGQLRAALAGVEPAQAAGMVIAYEPVWAIGTGLPATGEEANRVSALLRATVGEAAGADAAAQVRIQYGGSVNAKNCAEFLSQPEVDGALVGGASLDAEAFAVIVSAAARG
ncbi:MAG: triose-phosphate isomerase [Armatimonadetes bacterium]|nr:triose-phosphate isomerase [Armatimonadota bacterium]